MFEKYDRAVEAYVTTMKRNELSADSIKSYTKTFQLLRESMERNGYADVCMDAVWKFADNAGVKATSLALYLTHIRALSNRAVSREIVDAPFFDEDMMPSKKKLNTERSKPYEHVLTDEDAEVLINCEKPTHGRKSPTWLREKAEVTMLLQSGLRNSEIRSLRPCDLDWENGVAFPQDTKGDKPRAVVFSQAAQNAVRAYLESGLRPSTAGDEDWLFGSVDKRGNWNQMTRVELSERIKYYTKAVLGEDKSCRSHAMRHCYASVLLENNVPMELISETMGHASVATTKIYAARFSVNAPAMAVANVFNK
jgi:Site-specific recombinase XerD